MKSELCLLLLFFAIGLNAAEPAHRVGIHITPEVTLVPYTAEQFPDLADQIKPYMEDFKAEVTVLINHSSKDITAATVVWGFKSIERKGNPRSVTASFDQYHLPRQSFVPLAKAHSRELLAPAASGFAKFRDAADGRIQIEVDSIVFADGEIAGPDLLDAGHDITSRYQAGKLVSNRLHTGRLAGKGAAEVGEALTGDIVREQRRGFNWLEQYQVKLARISSNPENVEAFLNTLDNMVEPPKFHRAPSASK